MNQLPRDMDVDFPAAPALLEPDGHSGEKSTNTVYNTLAAGHIRLLVLFPGNFDDPLRGTLEHVELSDYQSDTEDDVGEEEHIWNQDSLSDDQPSDKEDDHGEKEYTWSQEASLDDEQPGSDEQDSEEECTRDRHKELAARLGDFTAMPKLDRVLQGLVPKEAWLPAMTEVEMRDHAGYAHTLQDLWTAAPCSDLRRPKKPFEAISYAWGSSQKPQVIYLNTNRQLRITQSLCEALRHLRYSHVGRRLWVDAICIDQSNDHERNEQVANMADIYHAADNVIVWLGAEEPGDTLAFATAELMCNLCITKNVMRTTDWYDEVTAHGEPGLEGSERVSAGLAGLIKLTHREWFTRLWVLQETKSPIARRVSLHSGKIVCSQYVFYQAIQFAAQCAMFESASEVWWLVSIDHDLMSPSVSTFSSTSVVTQLILVTARHCGDPRDRVFALRRLLCLEAFPELRPDYAIDPSELYRRLVVRSLSAPSKKERYSRMLWMASLGMVDRPLRTMGTLSWVVDLNSMPARSIQKQWLYDPYEVALTSHEMRNINGGSFQRTRHYSWYLEKLDLRTFETQLSDLELKGRIFAEVAAVREDLAEPRYPTTSEKFRKDRGSGDDSSAFVDWYDECARQYCSWMQEGDIDEYTFLDFLGYPTLWIYAYEHHKARAFVKAGFSRQWAQRTTGMQWTNNENSSPSSRSLREDCEAKASCLEAYMSGCLLRKHQRLCRIRTRAGWDIAWLPKSTKVGDLVCIFKRAMWPFAVRRRTDGKYQLIGDGHTYSTSLVEALGGDLELFGGSRRMIKGQPLGINMEDDPMLDEYIDHLYEDLDWIRLS